MCRGNVLLWIESESKVKAQLGQITFFQSVESGGFAEVKRLIDAGADVNAQDKQEYTALMWASQEGHTEIVELL